MIKPWMLVLGWAVAFCVVCNVLMYQSGFYNWTGWEGATLNVLTLGFAPVIIFGALIVGGPLGAAGAVEVTAAILFFALGLLQAAFVWGILHLVRRLRRGTAHG